MLRHSWQMKTSAPMGRKVVRSNTQGAAAATVPAPHISGAESGSRMYTKASMSASRPAGAAQQR